MAVLTFSGLHGGWIATHWAFGWCSLSAVLKSITLFCDVGQQLTLLAYIGDT
jgi:hypothetical protein